MNIHTHKSNNEEDKIVPNILLKRPVKITTLLQDKEGNWEIKPEEIQQESDTTSGAPTLINIGGAQIEEIPYIYGVGIGIEPHIGMIGAEPPRTIFAKGANLGLINTLQGILAHKDLDHVIIKKYKGDNVIIIGADQLRQRENGTLGDYAERLMEETRNEIFLITNTVEKYADIEEKIEGEIEENRKFNQRNAKYHNKFHNQKPGGAKGQYGNARYK